jgi:uncharacterized membrane protein YozB (DUF420 family)
MVLETGTRPAVRLRTPRLVAFMTVAAVVAIPVLLFPYLTLDPSRSRIPVTSELHYGVLVVHVVTAATALLLGVLQLVPRVRARRVVHRRLGRAFLLVGAVAFGLTGIPLALATPNGNVTRYGILVPAVGWLVCAALGWAAIRRRRIAAHREWMIRAYALTFFAITTRMLVPLLIAVQMPFQDDRSADAVRQLVGNTIPYGQWLGWILDLAIAQYAIRRLRRTPPTDVQQPADDDGRVTSPAAAPRG